MKLTTDEQALIAGGFRVMEKVAKTLIAENPRECYAALAMLTVRMLTQSKTPEADVKLLYDLVDAEIGRVERDESLKPTSELEYHDAVADASKKMDHILNGKGPRKMGFVLMVFEMDGNYTTGRASITGNVGEPEVCIELVHKLLKDVHSMKATTAGSGNA